MSVFSRSKNKAKSEAIIFGLILILLAIAMAVAIFLKQRSVTPDITFWNVLVWQAVLWTPLISILPSLRWVIKINKKPSIWFVIGFLLIALHYGWFVGMSSLISPYLEYPRTRYGVYPFFFIFWTLIDIFLVSGLLLFLLSSMKKKSESEGKWDSLYVKKGSKGVLLKPEEILWIGADDYYSDIHSTQGRFLERKPLKTLLEHLPEDSFVRIHRSTVVNLNAIREFRPISGLKAEVQLMDGNIRTVSRTYLKKLKERLAAAKV